MPDTVDTKSDSFLKMESEWRLPHDLLGGTQTMRDAGETWLPREPKEDPDSYEIRRERSFLYEAYPDTVEKLSKKPFIKPVSFSENLPERINQTTNVDNCGSSLTSFSEEVFNDAVIHGLSHVLIDYPNVNVGINLKIEQSNNIDPYFTHVKADSLYGFKWKYDFSGERVLSQVRIHEVMTEEDGEYGEKEVEYMRVLEEHTWELWKKEDGEEEYFLYDMGINTLGVIPLVTFYTNKTGFMSGSPPLSKLAWLNLAHWQSYSDQRNILRFARVGILFAAGFTEDELKTGIYVGPKKLTGSTNPDAKLKYVEHSGKSIEAGEKDLQNLEERMEVLGLQPLMSKTGDVKATGQVLGEMKNHSNMQTWTVDLSNTMKDAVIFKAKWIGAEKEVPKDFEVNIFNDFMVPFSGSEDPKTIISLYDRHLIKGETTVREVRRRGIVSESVDPETEVAEAREENGKKPPSNIKEGDEEDQEFDRLIEEIEEPEFETEEINT